MKLTINIDGGSRGNPGPAAYGCYLRPQGASPIELKGRLGHTTNNVAEYHGLLRGLEKAIELHADEVLIRADSELLVKQMRGEYRVKNEKLQPLFQAAQDLLRQLPKVQFQHVYREQNQEADRLCNEALDDPRLPIEPLGLQKSTSARPGLKSTNAPTQTKSPSSEKPAGFFKVKVSGTILSILQLQPLPQFAVVVNGTSWNLDLRSMPSGMKVGEQVVVLGDLSVRAGKPVIRVRKIKSMKND